MAQPYPVDETHDVLTVSRKDAQSYEKYKLWYENRDGLFTALGKFIGEIGANLSRLQVANQSVRLRSSVENLRNPVHRCAEFYATTMLTGRLEDALKIEESKADEVAPEREPEDSEQDEGKLKKAILKIWERSNLEARKQVAKRYLARDGQMFIKVVSPEGKDYCYEQFIPAKDVTDFETDERGNVTYIRLDVPEVRYEGAQQRKVWVTEIWRKGEGEQTGYALFAEAERTSNASSVASEETLAETRTTKRVELGTDSGYGFDFVPFVVVNAQDTGEKRPEAVYAHGLHLIAWVCREATRLSDLFFRFNKPHKVIFGIGNDPQGRLMPAPQLGTPQAQSLDAYQRGSQDQGTHTVPFGGSRGTALSRENEDISLDGIAVVGVPGNAQMADATPNLNFGAAREWINDHIREIYEELPELLYYAVESRANQSGAALRTLIAGALSRAEEMQDNLIAGLVKADKMALTVSQVAGFEGFSKAEIGAFEDGGFDHEIEPSEILPLTEEEKQAAQSGKLDNAQNLMGLLSQLGVSQAARRKVILTELGHEDLIDEASETAEPEGTPDAAELAGAQRELEQRLQSSTGNDTSGV